MSTSATAKRRTKDAPPKPARRTTLTPDDLDWWKTASAAEQAEHLNAAKATVNPADLATIIDELLTRIDAAETGRPLDELMHTLKAHAMAMTMDLDPAYRYEVDVMGMGPRKRELSDLSAMRLSSICENVRNHLHALAVDRPSTWADRLTKLRAAARGLRGDGIDSVPGKDFMPLDDDILILRALSHRITRTKADAIGVVQPGIRQVKMRLPILEQAGLVDRLAGLKKGWAITTAGREVLRTIRAK